MRTPTILLLCALMYPLNATAQTLGIALPGNSQAYNYDEIRTEGGTSCRQATGSDLSVEFGIVGSDTESDDSYQHDYERDFTRGGEGNAVYARVQYQIGAPKRLRCEQLFSLEIERLKAEIEALKKQAQFGMEEDW